MASVVALGNFDGLHRGHMSVINETKKLAESLGAKPYALVFREHPSTILTGEPLPKIFDDETRNREFKKLGVTLCFLDFKRMKDLSPEEFFEKIIKRRMGAKGVCCGFNYTFGKGGVGTPELLKKLCSKNDIKFKMAAELDFEGEAISSSRIREAIENGEIERANIMLGRPFTFRQTVAYGDKRGSLIGSPTVNLPPCLDIVEPRHGVYLSSTTYNGKKFYAVTNIGVRPTIGDEKRGSETHILDFRGNLYGRPLEISLLSFIRPEKKFESIKELEEQIHDDIRTARTLVNKITQ
ncbi:MAG: riboflavin biosynthesis protein RibF [Ruminococcaceae bacterium]|nr:riboflavin biosynthesis protein RibF [Oscillospiraceae bacterium]